MKIFHSELTANPAYYSYGYSVYGVLEPTDVLDEVYAQGYMPFIGAKDQPERMVYMARGTRVVVSGYSEEHYHRRALKKFNSFFVEGVDVIVHPKADFPVTDEFVQFLVSYFRFRFGKDQMSEERVRAICASPLLTHIVEYRASGKPAGYTLETQGTTFTHLWYLCYAKTHEDTCLGLYMYIDLLRRAKAKSKQYVYFGATYGNWMKYKTNFHPLEYWNGVAWVGDTKNRELKALLRTDPTRVLGFVDTWRETKHPFHRAPYPFASMFDELRFLSVMMAGTPRVFFTFILASCIVLAVAAFAIGF